MTKSTDEWATRSICEAETGASLSYKPVCGAFFLRATATALPGQPSHGAVGFILITSAGEGAFPSWGHSLAPSRVRRYIKANKSC